jgi:hypothetical protein
MQMRIVLVLAVMMFSLSGSAGAAGTAACAAKPFALAKPAQPQPKVASDTVRKSARAPASAAAAPVKPKTDCKKSSAG